MPGYVYVADDFTGASDTLATLARAGLRARLFLDVPTVEEVAGLDAFGIATEARALGNGAARALMDRIGAGLAPHRPDILHYKVCSTFDSAAETGNFIAATDRLRAALDLRQTAILGGQPSLGRYCIFGTLFARAGDGQVHRIDRHPVMSTHPVTPMGEADLRAHITALGGVRPVLADRGQPGLDAGAHTLFDVLEPDDLPRIGAVLQQGGPTLCIGASSVAQAVFGVGRMMDAAEMPSLSGPVLGFVGSRSEVSRRQREAARAYSHLPMTEDVAGRAVAALAAGQNTLIYIGSDTGPSARDLALGSARVIAEILSQVRPALLAIAGGDTSSAIITALAPQSLSFTADIDPGVPLCRAHMQGGWDLPVVLKGGQVGRADLFDHVAGVT